MNIISRGGDLRAAWLAVGLIPVAFVVAMVVGEGLIDALGYPSGGADPPLWAALLVGVPMTLLALAPALLAVVYGRRARRANRSRAALAAIVIGCLVTAYWLLTSIAGLAQRVV